MPDRELLSIKIENGAVSKIQDPKNPIFSEIFGIFRNIPAPMRLSHGILRLDSRQIHILCIQ
jgi:hypothetical protein